jgi:hypothetical protein
MKVALVNFIAQAEYLLITLIPIYISIYNIVIGIITMGEN